MTVASPLVRHRRRPLVHRWAGPNISHSLPVGVVALTAAMGVVLAAVAYTESRLGHSTSPWPDRIYWLGQALIVAPFLISVLARRRLPPAEAAALVVIITVAEYLIKVAYSPRAFTFPDELEHWRSTVNVMSTGRLFTTNYELPISPQYPGLEEVTSALSSVTGLSPFICGIVIAGLAHLLFVCLLYLLFREIGRSHRLAAVAIAFYATNSHFQYFDSIFGYQTLALAFLALCLFATMRASKSVGRTSKSGWVAVSVAATVATVVTHHVTSYVLVAILLLLALSALLISKSRLAILPGSLAVLAAAAVAAWVTLAAPGTVAYFFPVFTDIRQGLAGLVSAAHAHTASLSGGPLGDRVLSGAATVVVSGLSPIGWWRTWKGARHSPWIVAVAIASAAWFVVVAVRLGVPDGSELAGRAATFVYLPAAFMAAVGVAHILETSRDRMKAAVACAALFTLLTFDGLANGWPPYWERLPGPYEVAAFERSVEPEEISSAVWALDHLGPGNRFATDGGNQPVLGAYGYQNPVRNSSYLYESAGFSSAAASNVQDQSIRYVLVDLRLSKELPASGSYFLGSTGATTVLRAADLAKFNHIVGISRVYDSGDIIIYDLHGSAYAP
jgi:hypothetical protein